eukprot:2097218-Rhodomonas_salina.2
MLGVLGVGAYLKGGGAVHVIVEHAEEAQRRVREVRARTRRETGRRTERGKERETGQTERRRERQKQERKEERGEATGHGRKGRG